MRCFKGKVINRKQADGTSLRPSSTSDTARVGKETSRGNSRHAGCDTPRSGRICRRFEFRFQVSLQRLAANMRPSFRHPMSVEQSAVLFQLLLSSQSIFFGENSRATNRLQISAANGNIHSFYILMA
ncbi:hypothetical protein [Aliirhizobium smilacinae]|uniref:Uncharacterized protein n=1 Tax=Aliirhizobium smilacinae TaxID=1395944 RepID=A0A5C4XPD8_9HYPH|nr:hypothetical protein [Rhizobium smilacinae]TNM65283.1 hypothetical protein FHP24_03105 [Rhizobium smilacinae]